jgi:hypothetical protein
VGIAIYWWVSLMWRPVGAGMLTFRIAYWGMAETAPRFETQMTKSGRWFVSVFTGNGPNSHIGDFETEADGKNWILTKSTYWPSKPDAPK